jgi:hypothetical protein
MPTAFFIKENESKKTHWRKSNQMTERMKNYRLQKEIEGMVQLRVWVPKEHEDFFKELAKQARPNKPLKVPEDTEEEQRRDKSI